MNLLAAMDDPNLFQRWFKEPSTWVAWKAFLATLFNLPMDATQRDIALACTGLTELPRREFHEATLICGRRSGKSLMLALIAIFVALFRDWTPHLAPGERAVVLVMAADRRQAQSIMRYAKALIEETPLLAAKIERMTTEEIELRGRISVEVVTANYRTVRGRTVVCCCLDEVAFFRSEDSANPDYEIVAAIKPALASMPGSMMFKASSPHSQRGVLYDDHKTCYGVPGAPVLVWQAETRIMNPTIDQRIIDEAYERDPQAAAAEYGALFRSDVDTFVTRAVVDAATVPDRRELPPISGMRYVAFCDPSGGSSDSMTLAICHAVNGIRILDVVRERRPPFSPEATVAEFASILKQYRIVTVTGDAYAGEWVKEPFRKSGIQYVRSEQNKSQIYQALLPLLNSGQVELLDLPRLQTQLCSLERRTSRGGRDSIDHPPRAHDDIANAVAGAVVLAQGKAPMRISNEVLARFGATARPGSSGPTVATLGTFRMGR